MSRIGTKQGIVMIDTERAEGPALYHNKRHGLNSSLNVSLFPTRCFDNLFDMANLRRRIQPCDTRYPESRQLLPVPLQALVTFAPFHLKSQLLRIPHVFLNHGVDLGVGH